MRRALLVAAAAIPVVVLAAVSAFSGAVVETTNYNSAEGTSYVNALQCAGNETTNPLNLEWNIATPTGVTFLGGGSFNLFASDTQPAAGTGTTASLTFCAEQDSTTPTTIHAGAIASATANLAVQDLPVSGNKAVTEAGKSCDSAMENQVFWICAHWVDGSGNRSGSAIGKFKIQLAAPPVPTEVGIEEGDSALNVSWTEPSGNTAAYSYNVTATTADPRDPETHVASAIRSTSTRVGGLLNGVQYRVTVAAVSIGGNASAESAPQYGTPVRVLDFWNAYKNDGGQEQGGCGAGGTGPLALLGIATLLARVRRRK